VFLPILVRVRWVSLSWQCQCASAVFIRSWYHWKYINDAGTSNFSGGATIGANKQAKAALSTQTSQPLFDFGMTGGQLASMDTRTHEDVLGMAAGPSAVDTMQSTSSSLFNALG